MLRKDPAVQKQKLRDAVKAWKKANPEKVSAYNKAYASKNAGYFRKAAKEWAANNRASRNASEKLRSLSKKQRTPIWLTEFDLLKIKCIYSIAAMLTRENKEPWHVDHIIPLNGKNVSGLHVPTNLWFVKAKDNLTKSNKFKAKE